MSSSFFIARGYISAARHTSDAHLLSKNTNRGKAISISKKTIHGKTISISKKTIRGKAISVSKKSNHGKAISIVKIIKIISLTALQKAQYMIK